jgi:hypothetical protein
LGADKKITAKLKTDTAPGAALEYSRGVGTVIGMQAVFPRF